MNNSAANKKQPFRFEYEFDAPRKLVFEAFSTAEALNEWWGPAETNNSVIRLDFKKGGIFHFKMDHQGSISYGRFVFGEINPYDLLEFTNAFADEHAQVVKAPFDMDLPLEIFYRLHFTENNGRTTIRMTGEPVNATGEQDDVFQSINASMQEGFGGTFKKLAAFLGK